MRLWLAWILSDLESLNNHFVTKKSAVAEDTLLKEPATSRKWSSVILSFLRCSARIAILWGWLGKCRVAYPDWCSRHGKYPPPTEIGTWYPRDVFRAWDLYSDGPKHARGHSSINSWMILYKPDNKVGVIYTMWGCRFDGYPIEISRGVVQCSYVRSGPSVLHGFELPNVFSIFGYENNAMS